MQAEAGRTFSYDELEKVLKQHKPAVLFLCQVGLALPQVFMHGLADRCSQ